MEIKDLITHITRITEGYKGTDDPVKRLQWLDGLIQSYQRYLPARVVDKIKVDPSAKKIEGERRTVTVAFADLSGFTALSETMDAEDIAGIINDFFKRMVAVVFKYEGSVDKFLGDALMVLFGAPIAHHDDPERAVRASLEMQQEMLEFNKEMKFEQPLSMSIGINTGPVVALNVGSDERMEYTVIGDTVNLAARLEGVSQAGEIIISHNTYQAIADIVEVEKKPSVKVKGKRKPVLNYLVKEMREHFKLPDVTKLELVGRQTEVEKMHQALLQAKQGKGTIVGIVGDPGTGKTRLALEGVVHAQKEGFQTINARCMPYEANTPYVTIISVLNEYFKIKKDTQEEEKRLLISIKLKNLGLVLDETLPFIGILYGLDFPQIETMPPDEIKKMIFDAIKKLLFAESMKHALLVRIEDFQWIDPTSNELFDFMFKDITQCPILFMFEYRSDYAFPWLGMDNCISIVLKDLSKEETHSFAQKVVNVESIDHSIVDIIYDKSCGNPLFVQEIVKFLLKKGGIRRYKGAARATSRFKNLEIAESIAGVILAQIDRMSEEDRHILQYASIIGKSFQPSLLSRIIHTEEGALQQNLERLEHFEGVLVSQSETEERIYEFISPTAYEVIYGSLLKKRRKTLHTEIGEMLEQLHKERLPEYVEQLAYHFSRSNAERKGVYYLKSAADKSYHLYAVKEAISFFDRALELLKKKELTSDELKDTLEVLRRQGFLFMKIIGDFNQALKNQKRSLKLARQLNSDLDEAAALLNIGIAYQEMGVPKKGLNYWTKARRIATRIGEKKIQALAVNNLGNYYLHTGDLKKAFEHFQEVAAISEEMNDKRGMALAFMNVGNVLEQKGDFQKAFSSYKRAHNFFDELNEKEQITRCLNLMGRTQLSLGNVNESMSTLNEAVKLASEIGDKITESYALGNIGLVHAQMWRLSDAYEKFSQSLTIAKMIGEPSQIISMSSNIGDIHLYQGNLTQAIDIHREAADRACEIHDPFFEASIRKNLAWDYYYQGRFAASMEEFEKSHQLFEQIGDRRNSAVIMLGRAAVMQATGINDAAEQIINNIEQKARELKDPEILALALNVKADIKVAQQAWTDASASLEELPDLSRQINDKRLYAWAMAKHAWCALANHDVTKAQESLEKSMGLAQDIGDKILKLTNLLTSIRFAIEQRDYTNALNTALQATEQARLCDAKELLARGLGMTAHIFLRIGKSDEADKYLAEQKKVVAQITEGMPEATQESYQNKIRILW
jgi:adenylate cyclase